MDSGGGAKHIDSEDAELGAFSGADLEQGCKISRAFFHNTAFLMHYLPGPSGEVLAALQVEILCPLPK